MNFFEHLNEKAPWLEDCTIALNYHGSRAYGTDLEESDTDVRGVFIPAYDILVNPFQPPEQYGYHSEEADFLVFDIRKFLRLASKGNPNVIEMLWVEPEYWITCDPLWKLLAARKQMFVTQELAHSYIGYAISEVKVLQKSLTPGIVPPAGRKHLVDLYGFDTKSAMHSLRISRMCLEVCTQGTVQVHRSDAEELIGIRKGRRILKEIVTEVEENLIKSRELFRTNLPPRVDRMEVSNLCESIISAFLVRE